MAVWDYMDYMAYPYRRILPGIIYGDGDYLGILSIVRVIWMISMYDVD